jgi:hypothetical protein
MWCLLYFLCWSQTIVLGLDSVIMHSPEPGLYCQFFYSPSCFIYMILVNSWMQEEVPCSRYNDHSNNEDWWNFPVLRPSEFLYIPMCGNFAKVFTHQFWEGITGHCIVVNTITYCTKGFYFHTLWIAACELTQWKSWTSSYNKKQNENNSLKKKSARIILYNVCLLYVCLVNLPSVCKSLSTVLQ